MKKAQIALYSAGILLMVSACSCSKETTKGQEQVTSAPKMYVPEFSADSAFNNIARQVSFGPRIANSEAHEACGAWLASELKRHGADSVFVQKTNLDGFGPMTNIIGRYGKNKENRVLLLAHWDSRPTADEEADVALHSRPIDGANDGASGVGVLLELARLIGQKAPEIGVDILFVDAEDAGNEGDEDSWARGAQYFAENMPYGVNEPLPRYGVLLDMVGGYNAKFHRELFSESYSKPVVDKIWSLAKNIGLSSRFPDQVGGAINDDHLPLIRAGIPVIDIIESRNEQTGGFNPTWHTLQDNIQNIDSETLGAVGRLITQLIYTEKI
ncbi:MAG: M28 family peptidase [Muribaculaceae bacterium]|nr:M28 family peptidase [Muribaculaceae bacterium]